MTLEQKARLECLRIIIGEKGVPPSASVSDINAYINIAGELALFVGGKIKINDVPLVWRPPLRPVNSSAADAAFQILEARLTAATNIVQPPSNT